jgi:tetratricopeptide (TPR) repeat protein
MRQFNYYIGVGALNFPMKTILPIAALSLLTGIVAFERQSPATRPTSGEIAVCGPAYQNLQAPLLNGKYVVALPGWGDFSYKVSTSSDSSQFYFDQGLNMYYGYHFKEAVASFREAARIDSANAMAFWGQALAMGPYYNAAHTYTKPAEVAQALAKMNSLTAHATGKEKLLIDAMNVRYSDDPTDSRRAELNQAYSDKLKKLVADHPDENEFKLLYIDSQMLMHAWDFWKKDGTAKPWTPELVALCEKALKAAPKHPAALHYHIHLTEASKHPEVALASAEALRDLLPGVAHMVHMASHEYERNGLFAEGVEVNNLADDALLNYDMLAKNLSLTKHSPHYFAVQTYCALTAGMYHDAIRYARRSRQSVAPKPETTYDQYLFMLPVMAQVRMGKWQQILTDSVVPDPKWSYAGLLSDFAKGIAFANTGRPDSAAARLESLKIKAQDPVLTKRRIPFNSPVEIAAIAQKVLEGVVAISRNERAKGFAALEEAVKLEDKLIYTEPKDWPLPARQFLGAYLLKSGKPALAEKVYREDLVFNPANGWSLVGLSQSLKAQRKTKQLAGIKAKYERAFAKAEQIPTGSVFIR